MSHWLKRMQFLETLEEAAGAWKDEDHPELREKGTYQWVRNLREGGERRLEELQKRVHG